MAARISIPHRACVVVCDGRRALFLENRGDPLSPNLQLDEMLEFDENPPTREQGSDRPGRVVSGSHRSSVEGKDFHRAAGEEFAVKVVQRLEQRHKARPLLSIFLVAPPRTLTVVRKVMPDRLRTLIDAEINKDLTKMSVSEIERAIGS